MKRFFVVEDHIIEGKAVTYFKLVLSYLAVINLIMTFCVNKRIQVSVSYRYQSEMPLLPNF